MVQVFLPELGENITKATVSFWHVEEGATIEEGSDLVEMATDKAVFNVPAPCSGTIIEIVAHEGDTIEPGEALAVIEEDTVAPKDKEEVE